MIGRKIIGDIVQVYDERELDGLGFNANYFPPNRTSYGSGGGGGSGGDGGSGDYGNGKFFIRSTEFGKNFS